RLLLTEHRCCQEEHGQQGDSGSSWSHVGPFRAVSSRAVDLRPAYSVVEMPSTGNTTDFGVHLVWNDLSGLVPRQSLETRAEGDRVNSKTDSLPRCCRRDYNEGERKK